VSEFDLWRRWGIDLDDTMFANAWAALGIALAAGKRRATLPDVMRAVLSARNADDLVPWAFPVNERGTASERHLPRLVSGTSPVDWANVWKDIRSDVERLRIVASPVGEPALPWVRFLSTTQPHSRSVSFRIEIPRAECQIGWPLRFGFLGSGSAKSLVDSARKNWPANLLSQSIALGRDQANCDMLVHRGTTKSLLKELIDRRTKIKANLVLLYGCESDEWGDLSSRLAAILTEVRASGYVLIPGSFDYEELAHALNELVTEIAHASTFDVAVAKGFGRRATRSDIIGGFTDRLLRFHLPLLADTFTRRLKSMPAGTAIDLSSLGGPDRWSTRGVYGAYKPVGIVRRNASFDPAAVDLSVREATGPLVVARTLRIEADQMEFGSEKQGGSDLAAVAAAIEKAELLPRARMRRVARFLQQQSFVRRGREFEEATQGFVAGAPALVRVRIGPQTSKWNSLATVFPVENLPPHIEHWSLTMWLSEPNHLPEPMKAHIKLPRDGASTECEFLFKPLTFPQFEGRITVVHRGRVIQTAALRASVRATTAQKGSPPALKDFIPVRRALGDLKERRQFDLAFVLNHTEAGRPLSLGLSEKYAWISDLRQSVAIAKDINTCLSPVANSVVDYANGLNGEKGRELLVKLAALGSYLHLYLVEQQLGATGNRPELAHSEYLQIVSTRSDAVIPFEFIYDYMSPNRDAKVCEHWKQALINGACAASCDQESPKTVCPMGFWGLQKVIERHALTPELAKDGRELYLQSEATSASGTLHLGGVGLFGASNRVNQASLKQLETVINQQTGKKASHAKDWDTWVTLVHDNHPNLLIALAHADGIGADVSLELGGETITTIQITQRHIRTGDAHPLVALLGCDVVGTADDYGNHVAIFRERGAAIVIGTIASVFGDHAAQVACRLVEGLLSDDSATPFRLGEALRALKRKALLDNLVMPLCLVAYGDADWTLSKG
jgi:hypothetical protein